MLTAALGTGPPFSSVTRPERVAPETWARVGVAEKRAKASASDRQIHFAKDAKEELQPLLNILIPLARSPVSVDPALLRQALARRSVSQWMDRPIRCSRM